MENTNVNTSTTEQTNVGEAKTYTEAEMQSYADRRVTEAMKTARSKFENEKKEAERLASMSAEERFTEELNKREKELDERMKQVTMLENKHAAMQILADKNLPIELVDFVLAETAEEMNTKINTLEKTFNASVQTEIEKRLKGATPIKATGGNAMTKEDIRKMSLADQQKMYKSNPDLYKSLYS